ncbi:PHA/PHB synthase family protein [Benzoatithermus flavus]|uniref:Class I poly(R)-hydroxyalkanoic acid synthase n=1 Tax=Benzoatithermus flavus TaxID=3108223 RepID=A0ABU8XWM0_9PROT
MVRKAARTNQDHRSAHEGAGTAQPEAQAGAGGSFPPDLGLGVWTSWMKDHLEGAGTPGLGAGTMPWWSVSQDGTSADLLSGGTDRLEKLLTSDPMLSAIDRMWNLNPLHDVIPIDWAEVAQALRTVWLRRLADPARALPAAADLQVKLWHSAIEAWNDAAKRWWGVAEAASPGLGAGDKRFEAPEWQNNPVYRMLKDAYLLASDFLLKESEADDLDPKEQQRLRFHLTQFVNAMSPTLLLFSNPAALRRMMETGGASLADGLRNLMADLKEGRLSMVDATAFEPGRNLAITPGKVVFRNRLIELIQYTPTTEKVRAVPLLFVPPWINKFYILDLQPKNSFVKYLVEQGFTVFMLSWKNPDAAMESMTFEDYMREGPLAASDVAREITGSATVNPVGYCIGGTLLITILSALAAKKDGRFGTATFMVSLQDFEHVGETAVFMDEPSIEFIEQQMMQRGYLDSREMANMFNLLRSNDLIWANVVNNYLMGNKPPAFDLLYWNSDGTRMARAAHSWYLRNTYVENNLIKPGKVKLLGEPIDLGRIRQDIYAVGAEKDHIVPWDAAWRITRLVGGKVRFVMASSGHIAGIINPPSSHKGAYWVNEAPAPDPRAWLANATRFDGSWWTDWVRWLGERSGEMVKPPSVGSKAYPPLTDAPGTYVLEK